ncbi:MAG: hypothetical protein IKB31_05665 [Bacteroidaceae bacterium]|nr:hypothetical protein [Bacteroidaceae bacterium]
MKAVVHPDYQQFEDFISSLPGKIDRNEGELLCQGRNVVRLFGREGEKYVVKRFKKANFFQRIAYTFFRKTKAERAYLYAGELRSRGFDTPHEIAYFEDAPGGLFQTGYFVSSYCDYPTAYPALVKTEDYDKKLAASIAEHLAALHRKGVLFGDLNLNNFLYHPKDDAYELVLIDTNRSTFRSGVPSFEECMLNLQTLTHRRDLLEDMLSTYSKAMGWPKEQVVEGVFKALDRFEARRSRKKKFKRMLGI